MPSALFNNTNIIPMTTTASQRYMIWAVLKKMTPKCDIGDQN